MRRIKFDARKDQVNRAKHGIALARAIDFEWDASQVEPDLRRDYGELRYTATGFLDGRLHVLVFAPRGTEVRVISLRRANTREQARHAQKTETGSH